MRTVCLSILAFAVLSCSVSHQNLNEVEPMGEKPRPVTGYGEDLRVDLPVGHWSFDGASGEDFATADWSLAEPAGQALRLGREAYPVVLQRERSQLESFTLTLLANGAIGELLRGETAGGESFVVSIRKDALRLSVGEHRWDATLPENDADTWRHVAIIHDAKADEFGVYVEGKKQWAADAPADFALRGAGWRVGSQSKGNGLLDEVALFDRTLHPSHLLGHALVRRGLRPARKLDAPLELASMDQPGELEHYAVSPDNALLAEIRKNEGASDYPRIAVRSLENGALVGEIIPRLSDWKLVDSGCSDLRFDPTGRLVGCRRGEQIHLWDVYSGHSWQTIKASSYVQQWLWRPGGRELVVVTSGKDEETPPVVELWQPALAERLVKWPYSQASSLRQRVELLGDGRWLVSCGSNSLEIWDLAERDKLEPKTTPFGNCHVKGTHDGKGLVLVGNLHSVLAPEQPISDPEQRALHIYSVPDSELVQTLPGHKQAIIDAVFSPNARFVATRSQGSFPKKGKPGPDRTSVWALEDGSEHGSLESRHWVRRLSDDGNTLLIRYRRGHVLYDLAEDEVVARRQDAAPLIEFSRTRAVTVGAETMTVASLVDLSDVDQLELPAGKNRQPTHATADGDRILLASQDKTAAFDWRSGQITSEFAQHFYHFEKDIPELGRRGDLLAQEYCTLSKGLVRIWSASKHEVVADIELRDDPVGRCAREVHLDPKNRRAVIATYKGISAWDLRTSRRLWFQPYDGLMLPTTLTQDGEFLYVVHDTLEKKGRFLRIRVADGQIVDEMSLHDELQRVQGKQKGVMRYTDIECFASNQCLLTSYAGLLRVDPTAKKLTDVTPLEDRAFGISARMTVDRAEKRVLLWSNDVLEVRLLDAMSGELLRTYKLPRPPVAPVTFLGEDKQDLFVPVDGGADVWLGEQKEPIRFRFSYLDDRGSFAWMAMLPDGTFAGSSNLPEAGLSASRGLRSVSLEQLAVRYNRPASVLRILGYGNKPHLTYLEQLWKRRLRKAGLDPDRPADAGPLVPPQVSIAKAGEVSNDGTVTLTVDAFSEAAALAELRVWVNGTLQPQTEQTGLAGFRQTRTIKAKLSDGTNVVQLAAAAQNGLASAKASQTFTFDSAAKPTLYLAALGVSEYESKLVTDLEFADDDARDLVEAFEKAKADKYEAVKTLTLLDKDVDNKALKKVHSFVANAAENDVVVIFAAGHGMYDKGEPPSYFYLTQNADLDDLKSTALPFDAFAQLLRGIRSHRKLLLLDTCASGEFPADVVAAQIDQAKRRGVRARTVTKTATRGSGGNKRRPWLLERHRLVHRPLRTDTGAVVLSSSLGAELSLESDRWRNGAFTESLLSAMSSGGYAAEPLTIRRLQQAVRDKVVSLTQDAQHPTIDRDNLLVDFALPYTKAYQRSHIAGVGGVAVSADGKSLLVQHDDHTAHDSPADRLRVYGLPSGRNAKLLPPMDDWFMRLAWSPDGSKILTDSGSIRSAATGKVLGKVADESLESLAWSVDDKIAIGLDDGRVEVYDADSFAKLHTWQVSEAEGDDQNLDIAVSFSADGKTLVALGDKGRVRAWKMPSGAEIADFQTGAELVSGELAVSRDGKRIAFAYDGVQVWSVSQGSLVLEIATSFGRLSKVAISADGSTVYAARAGRILAIDVDDAEIVTAKPGPSDRVEQLLLDQKSNHLVSVEDNGMIRVWKPETLEQLSSISLDIGR